MGFLIKVKISKRPKLLISKTGRVIALAIIGGLLSGIVANGYQVVRANSPTQQKSNWVEMQTDYHSIYLPIVLDNFPLPQTFGVETSRNDLHQINMTDEANAYWLRSAFFDWESIQPQRTGTPKYHWDTVNEWALQEASLRGINIIATVKYTPSWAQKYKDVSCGPVAQDSLDEFAQFMVALVERYGAPPYNVKYWEIGNEPDVDRSLVPPNNFYGCWGEIDDHLYYGGEYYAEMLKHVYPAVKAVDPNAKILVGGLLLDCDPTDPQGEDCNPGNFLEGILHHYGANDGGNYFDIVSFHGFAPYIGSLVWDEAWSTWGPRGGVVLGKADFLREVMAKYGVDKPLFLSEASLLCPPSQNFLEEMGGYGVENPLLYSKDALLLSSTSDFTCDPPDAQFYEAQADYVIWVHVRNIAAGIMGTTWYTITGPGWVNGGLLDGNQNPRPAYNSFQFMAEELRNANYIGKVWLYYSQYPLLRVYEFKKSGKRIWVIWASDEQPSSIKLPGETTKVFDKYGDDITPANGQITVKSPIYVELTP
jgi:hypothetical protein